MDKEIKKCVQKDSVDVDKCLAIMDDLNNLPVNQVLLKKNPDIMKTIKMIRKFKGSDRIRKKAELIYHKFKGFFLAGDVEMGTPTTPKDSGHRRHHHKQVEVMKERENKENEISQPIDNTDSLPALPTMVPVDEDDKINVEGNGNSEQINNSADLNSRLSDNGVGETTQNDSVAQSNDIQNNSHIQTNTVEEPSLDGGGGQTDRPAIQGDAVGGSETEQQAPQGLGFTVGLGETTQTGFSFGWGGSDQQIPGLGGPIVVSRSNSQTLPGLSGSGRQTEQPSSLPSISANNNSASGVNNISADLEKISSVLDKMDSMDDEEDNQSGAEEPEKEEVKLALSGVESISADSGDDMDIDSPDDPGTDRGDKSEGGSQSDDLSHSMQQAAQEAAKYSAQAEFPDDTEDMMEDQ
ncbi:uncharacterized protein, partial [Argopecten irradians]|uniref:uncharacterized protein n=1 Tax=Argopecten irradians TaxID=31199 RepID=UPI003721DF6F